MLVHDIIKIKYVQLGYIKKNYPYHLISDEEMFNAFIDLGNAEFNSKTTVIDPRVRFFDMLYPNPFAEHDYIYEKTNSKGEVVAELSLNEAYLNLKADIIQRINNYLSAYGTLEESANQVPDWIYTYMLGEVVYNQSDYLDIENLLDLLGCSNIDNEFTRDACVACFATSLNYISILTTGLRPPTIFGEPHVIKSLRMST